MPFPALIEALRSPDAYPHTVERVSVRETHISWVLLTGEFAYKVKKPVDLGFVDFTTLQRRRHFCEEEIRLNRRFAPALYLDVVPITPAELPAASSGRGQANDTPRDGTPRSQISMCGRSVRVGGEGEPLEYAVRMRQFDEDSLLLRMLRAGSLEPGHLDQLAAVVQAAHSAAPRASAADEWGTPAHIRAPAEENFQELVPLLPEPDRRARLQRLSEWSRQELDRLEPVFRERRAEGFVRECHGDLHLGNIICREGRVIPFDCIEFNPDFRWIDVINELAFLVMDLDDHGRTDLGRRFLNTSLEHSGDYGGLRVLPFYLVYRAIVRAKVHAIRAEQAAADPDRQQALREQCHTYLDLAEGYTRRPPPTLTITHGVSGSGKTTGTQAVLEREGAIRIRSDIERKRLFGLSRSDRVRVGLGEGIYAPQASECTYQRLLKLAGEIIDAGFPVIVDAAFLRHADRGMFRELAAERGVSFQIMAFDAPETELRQRIRQRARSGADASDASEAVLDAQLKTRQPLTAAEREFVAPQNGA